jgi:hypothetical protein
MSSEIVVFGSKPKDFVHRVTGFVKKAIPVVKKVFKNPFVKQALNALLKFVTSEKKSAWGDTLNKTTRLLEDTYHKFTKERDEPEEPQNRI